MSYLLAVPPPKLYLQLNPVQVTFDPLSILWLNSFGRSLQRALVTEPAPPPSYLDVHLEAVMPKVSRAIGLSGLQGRYVHILVGLSIIPIVYLSFYLSLDLTPTSLQEVSLRV